MTKKNDSNISGAVIFLGAAVLGGVLMGFRKGITTVDPVFSGYNPDSFSRYYLIDDVEKSNTAAANNIDNTATTEAIENASVLAQIVLDPLTDAIGGKLVINSWYRSPAVNSAVGGSDTSDHLDGLAADVESPFGDNLEIAEKMLQHEIPFDQMILYDNASNPSRIHLSIDPLAQVQRKQILLKKNGSYSMLSVSDVL